MRKQLPALIFVHGGPQRQMLRGFHYRYYYSTSYAFNQYLASRGYVVLALNYRRSLGYGLEFREALDYGVNGASELNDLTAAAQYLQRRADVDSRRIGLWGGSYGGYLTALALARRSDVFAAGVDIHGRHDWSATIVPTWLPSFDPKGANVERARLAFASSPISAVVDWRSPVLFIHGDDDNNVLFSETVSLVSALRSAGVVEPEVLVLPNEAHDFLMHASWVKTYAATADFLHRQLRPGWQARSQ